MPNKNAKTLKFCVWGPSGFSIMGRETSGGSNLTQAGTTSITYKIFDLATPSTVFASGTLTVSSVIFDTLQTDSRWSKDDTGYNFRWDVPKGTLTGDATDYRIEVLFTPVSGEAFYDVWDPQTLPIYSE